jgi:branched-chain amino acid transport system permease protein
MKKTSWLSAKNVVLLLLLLLALLAPVIVKNPFYFHLITLSYIWCMLASSLNICMGYTGLVSVAQGSFFGIGAYAVSLFVIKGGMNYWFALPLSLGIVIIISIGIGLIALRTRGPYFVIFTLCVCLIVTVVIEHWYSLTEGNRGLYIPTINPINIPGIGKLSFTSAMSQYYLILFFLLFTLFIMRLIIYSRVGRAFEAVRLNEILADALGINITVTKMFAFSLGAFFAGIGGVLYPPYISYLNPADSSFWISFNAILYVVVGGSGTLMGPLIGAISMTIIPELLRFLAEFRLLFYGLVLIIVVIFLPKGLVSLPSLLKTKVIASTRKER